MNILKILFLSFFSLIPLSYGCINLDIQIDGNTTNSAFDIDVKYRPSVSQKPESPKPQQTHDVTVGQKDSITTFTPQNVTVGLGDLVVLHFVDNRTLTSSSP